MYVTYRLILSIMHVVIFFTVYEYNIYKCNYDHIGTIYVSPVVG